MVLGIKIGAALMLASATATAAENYCNNAAVDAEWERLITRYEGDPDFSYMYSLREDLCADVHSGRLSLADAITRFEAERARVIEQRLKRLQELHGARVGAG